MKFKEATCRDDNNSNNGNKKDNNNYGQSFEIIQDDNELTE